MHLFHSHTHIDSNDARHAEPRHTKKTTLATNPGVSSRARAIVFVLPLLLILVTPYVRGQINASSCPPLSLQPPPNLVAWWPMGEGSGATTISDNSASASHTGTVHIGAINSVHGPSSVTGFVGKALQFASNTYVEVNAPDLNFGTATSFSIDAWVKGATGPIVSNFDVTSKRGYSFYITNNHQLAFDIGRGFQIMHWTGPAITPNAWCFVAVVIQRPNVSGVTFYVAPSHGPLAKTIVPGSMANDANASSGQPLIIGKSGNAIDELEIFNHALLQPDVDAIFAAKQFGKCWRNNPH